MTSDAPDDEHKKLVIGICPDPNNSRSADLMTTLIEAEGGKAYNFYKNPNNTSERGERGEHLDGYVERLDKVHRGGNLVLRAHLQKIDGLVILGNDKSDIDPRTYGVTRIHSKTRLETRLSKSARTRAEYEDRLIKMALEEGVPLLGICHGMERIGKACGAQLHQDLRDLLGHNKHAQEAGNPPIPPEQPTHFITAQKGTKFAGILRSLQGPPAPGEDSAPQVRRKVNSRHHQALATPGKNLRIAAVADDILHLPGGKEGLLIEAIEADPHGAYKNQFVLGVQCHPEYDPELGAGFVHRLVKEAHTYRNHLHAAHDDSGKQPGHRERQASMVLTPVGR